MSTRSRARIRPKICLGRELAVPAAMLALVVACKDKSEGQADGKRDQDNTAEPSAQAARTSPAATKQDQQRGPCPEAMVAVAGGKFFAGTDDEKPIFGRARPAHQVEIDSYCIGINEVTLAEYAQCVKAGACEPAHEDSFYPKPKSQDEDAWRKEMEVHNELCNANYDDRGSHPVNCVTWAQAAAYCEFKDARLPTEAEWEFAARGSDGRVYPWGDESPDELRANGCDPSCVQWRKKVGLADVPRTMYEGEDGYAGTAPVGSFPAGKTQYGLNDMVGNVFEWVADYQYAYTKDAQKNPRGPSSGTERIIRGGAFNSFMPEFADPAFRYSIDEKAHSHGIGFRCAADQKPA